MARTRRYMSHEFGDRPPRRPERFEADAASSWDFETDDDDDVPYMKDDDAYLWVDPDDYDTWDDRPHTFRTR